MIEGHRSESDHNEIYISANIDKPRKLEEPLDLGSVQMAAVRVN